MNHDFSFLKLLLTVWEIFDFEKIWERQDNIDSYQYLIKCVFHITRPRKIKPISFVKLRYVYPQVDYRDLLIASDHSSFLVFWTLMRRNLKLSILVVNTCLSVGYCVSNAAHHDNFTISFNVLANNGVCAIFGHFYNWSKDYW